MIRSRCDGDRGATSWTTLTVRTSAGGVRSRGGGDQSGRSWVVYEIAIGWIHSLESRGLVSVTTLLFLIVDSVSVVFSPRLGFSTYIVCCVCMIYCFISACLEEV